MGWLLAAVLAAQAQTPSAGAELGLVQLQIAALEKAVREGFLHLETRLAGLEAQRPERAPESEALAAAFLAGPPPSSDSVGVAKVAVFAPRLVVDSPARHDLVFVRVRRVAAEGLEAVGQVELGQEPEGIALPVDRNGALYVVDWSTSDGHSYELQLRDGLSGLVSAAVKVKPLEHEGLFLLVGYAVE